MEQRFVHLHLHTEYSLVDGLICMEPLVKALPQRGMSAVAVTDHCNLFVAVKFYKKATAVGIKPILGAEIVCQDAAQSSPLFSLVLLCQNTIGYKNLTCIISKAYQEGQQAGQPVVQQAWLAEYSEGLIALSGGMRGNIGQALLAEDMETAKARASWWREVFPNRFYLEIQRTGRANEAAFNRDLLKLAESLHLPLVATNDVRFLEKDDFDAHEARVCIHEGYTLADTRREQKYNNQQYLRSAEEMLALFQDLPSATANTVEIAKRCTVTLDLGNNYLPDFPIPAGSTMENYLSTLSMQGLNQRIVRLFRDVPDDIIQEKRKAYDKRLETELSVINRMGFAGYFLIVADFIQWGRDNGVPVGPGRGSGAGSLVAYALKITDLDPLEYDLLFERFLNPERVSMPDFDIDFCMEGRDRVIEYVAEKYGRQSVSQIITFGTMAAKAVIRDVGRVLAYPYNFVDELAKLIPFELGITLEKAMEQEADLKKRYEQEEEVKDLFDLALKLEGLTRNAGKHAGGVVIAPSKLTDFTAVYCEEGSTQLLSQFDKDDVEAVGLVKFDFLGLRTLTIIDKALHIVNEQRRLQALPAVDITEIPMDDAPTFALLKACETTAVFQLESRGMKEIIHRLQPDCFEEIIALVALFRPGPLQSGMVDDFIDRKQGRAEVVYAHPDLENILKPTYGVILYQEQVMQIAQVLANYTLGAADLLRRAMGKKKPEEMASQRMIFVEGAIARDIKEETAVYIFDLMEKFAGYGFNKSHSAAYALVSYQTAWLKAHYPAAFMAAVLSSDMDHTDKVVNFLNECKNMQLRVVPPSVNSSQYMFTVLADTHILYGLGAIKGVGESAIGCVIAEREKNGQYQDLFDFCKRLDLRKVNRRVIEAFIRSGAMDEWGVDRAILLASLDKALKTAEQHQSNKTSGQYDLFAFLEDEKNKEEAYVQSKSLSILEKLTGEYETLGLYLTGHPAMHYCLEFANFVTPIKQLHPGKQKKVLLCGQITAIRKLITKNGKKLVIVGVEDGYEKIEIVVYGEIFEQFAEHIQVKQVIVAEGEIAADDYNGGVKMTAKKFYSTAQARVIFGNYLKLQLSSEIGSQLPVLESLLKACKGACLIQIHYRNSIAKATLQLSETWKVNPDDAFLSQLKALLGEENVCMMY